MQLLDKLGVCADPANEMRAKSFAERYGLMYSSLCDVESGQQAGGLPYYLAYQDRKVLLKTMGKKAPGPVTASFLEGKVKHRQQYGGGQGQMIAKAIGLKSGIRPAVLDATAGLGRDAFVLASLGCQVQMLESSPWVAELLQAGLDEAAQSEDDPEITAICARMTLHRADAVDWLSRSEDSVADVIYLDPMYPHREKSALVKKEMRAFHDLLGVADSSADLLAIALEKARYRVVVKRPRKGERIAGREPNLVMAGKSCRYDIYTISSMTALKDSLSNSGN